MINRRTILTCSLACFALILSGCHLTKTRIVIENEGSNPLSVAASFSTEAGTNGFLKTNIAVGRWGLLKFLTADESGTEVTLSGTYTFDGGVETDFSVTIILGEKNVIAFDDDGPIEEN